MTRERLAIRQASQTAREPDESNAPPDQLPIGQVFPLYPREWVLVRVATLDARQNISHVEVLCHSRSRKKISAARLAAHREDPGVRTFVFYGGPVAYSLDELPRLLDEAEALYPDAWR